jgi:hypothetical protein
MYRIRKSKEELEGQRPKNNSISKDPALVEKVRQAVKKIGLQSLSPRKIKDALSKGRTLAARDSIPCQSTI